MDIWQLLPETAQRALFLGAAGFSIVVNVAVLSYLVLQSMPGRLLVLDGPLGRLDRRIVRLRLARLGNRRGALLEMTVWPSMHARVGAVTLRRALRKSDVLWLDGNTAVAFLPGLIEYEDYQKLNRRLGNTLKQEGMLTTEVRPSLETAARVARRAELQERS